MMQDLSLDLNPVDSLKSWLIDWMAREMEIDHSTVDTSRPFLSYGLESMKATMMVGDIEAKLSLRLPPTLAWDYPDIDALATHLAELLTAASSASAAPLAPEARATASPGTIESLLARLDSLGDQDVDSLLQRYADRAS